MPKHVLHLLSQRPAFTGSGVSLDSIVRLAAAAGWQQDVVVGTPAEDPHPQVGGLDAGCIHPLRFERGSLDFPLPGMSDVMPYRSSRFSELNTQQLRVYREAWQTHIARVLQKRRPDVIHTRHIWLLSSMIKDIAPDLPVVNHCHATGLRQMELCPLLADEVRRGCGLNDRFFVLHQGHAEALRQQLEVESNRIHIVGAGYREDVFHAQGRSSNKTVELLYAGKYSHAKGLPQLLDAVERLFSRYSELVLHIAGDGAGAEAEALRTRMSDLAPRVVMHGQVDQQQLAALMRRSHVFVLPSFYEGLPLVLVEALACGCRLVCTDLPGVRHGLGTRLDSVIERVPLPRLCGPDAPVEEDLPAFVSNLESQLIAALEKPPLGDPAREMPDLLAPFTWRAVFDRIEKVWLELSENG